LNVAQLPLICQGRVGLGYSKDLFHGKNASKCVISMNVGGFNESENGFKPDDKFLVMLNHQGKAVDVI